jgi:hypothetical protein
VATADVTRRAWLLVGLAACGTSEPAGPPVEPPLEPVCTPGTRWSAGQVVFREVTSDWQIDGVDGIRLAAVDFDGDGWTDLAVRHASDAASDSSEPPACCSDQSCAEGVICPVRRVWLLRNRGDRTFEDVTSSSGILENRSETNPNLGRPAQVFAFGDVDNDGDLDVYTGRGDGETLPQVETSELMLNDGAGSFAFGPAESPLRILSGDSPSGAAFTDYDKNGLLDLWVTRNTHDGVPRPDALFAGTGSGGFVEVSDPAGLTTRPWMNVDDINAARAHSIGWGALACDLNGDGYPELLAASYGRAPNHLWQALGPDAAFAYQNRSIESGCAFDHRSDWTDNESARCYCTLNPDAEDCAGVPEPQTIACNSPSDVFRWNHSDDREPYRLGGNSGSTMCGDVDNDGDMDLLTTEIVHWDVGSSSDPSELLFNSGESDVRFERPGNEVTGLSREHAGIDWNDGDISGALFDFDNDGWLDVYIASSDYPGTRGLLFHQTTPGSFEAVPVDQGIDHTRSHGTAVADFDHDGDLDIALGHSRARCASDCYPTGQMRLFENLSPQGNWLQMTLTGRGGSNRAAIGARVTVRREDGVVVTQEVGGGHGHYGVQHDLTLHVGLGPACRAEVIIRWPDAAQTEETHALVSGYRFLIEQGGSAVPVPPQAAP